MKSAKEKDYFEKFKFFACTSVIPNFYCLISHRLIYVTFTFHSLLVT
jgi:hypothetical protein